MAALAAVAAIGAAALFLIRRRDRGPALLAAPAAEPIAEPAPAVAPPARPVPVAEPVGARLALSFRPVRAGLNLLSATVQGEITLLNTGDAPAEAIRVEARLLSAHAGQDAEIAAALAEPSARTATPPFTLAPGEERRVEVAVAMPHEAIRPFAAGGRQMFVPLVAVGAHFQVRGEGHRSGRAFAVGIERVDSAKLGPFRLDAGPRMHADVAARPHGDPVER